MRIVLCSIVFLCVSLKLIAIPVLYTAALIDNQYEMRKQEYLYSFQILKQFKTVPYILESCKISSFFDYLETPLLYTQTNDICLKNKGINEAMALLKGLKHFAFPQDQMLVKLTGRYFFTSPKFFTLIQNHPEMDAFVKRSYGSSSIFTGCFALRHQFFQQFLEGLDLEKMEREMINIEDELAKFFTSNPQIKVFNVGTLDVTANIFGEGRCMLTFW
jgi:hypothetical protein